MKWIDWSKGGVVIEGTHKDFLSTHIVEAREGVSFGKYYSFDLFAKSGIDEVPLRFVACIEVDEKLYFDAIMATNLLDAIRDMAIVGHIDESMIYQH